MRRGAQRFEISDSEFEIAFLCASVANCLMPYTPFEIRSNLADSLSPPVARIAKIILSIASLQSASRKISAEESEAARI
jgi:hypothetical protein